MKHLYVIASILCAYQTTYALTIPKSSLEVVKIDVESSLKKAQELKDKKLIDKYDGEIAELNKKIKKFEREWLEYRKNQLTIQSPVTPEITAEMNEIEALLKTLTP